MIQIIVYLLITSYMVEDTVCATFQEFIRNFPEKIADAFRSSWRVITQGTPELRRTQPPRGMTEGPLWIKIPKRDGSKPPQKTRIEGAEPLKSQVINLRETSMSHSLQEVTEWFSTLVSSKMKDRNYRPDGRRINQESHTKLRIPFFTPPKSDYNYLMRTVLWRTPRNTDAARFDNTKGMASTVNLSLPTLNDVYSIVMKTKVTTAAATTVTTKIATTEATTVITKVANTLAGMKTTVHTNNTPNPLLRLFSKRFRFQIFNKFKLN